MAAVVGRRSVRYLPVEGSVGVRQVENSALLASLDFTPNAGKSRENAGCRAFALSAPLKSPRDVWIVTRDTVKFQSAISGGVSRDL